MNKQFHTHLISLIKNKLHFQGLKVKFVEPVANVIFKKFSIFFQSFFLLFQISILLVIGIGKSCSKFSEVVEILKQLHLFSTVNFPTTQNSNTSTFPPGNMMKDWGGEHFQEYIKCALSLIPENLWTPIHMPFGNI